MRYAVAVLLTLGVAVSGVPAGFAAEREGPQTPAATVAQYDAGDPGTVAGPTAPGYHVPVVEHDANRN